MLAQTRKGSAFRLRFRQGSQIVERSAARDRAANAHFFPYVLLAIDLIEQGHKSFELSTSFVQGDAPCFGRITGSGAKV